MAIVINNFDENVESGDNFTTDLTGDDNGVIQNGHGIDTVATGVMDGATLGAENFTADNEHDTETTFGTRTFTSAGGFIKDADAPSGSNTFTQNTSGTPFDDTTYNLLTVSGLDQTTPEKTVTTPIISYNDAAPGSITFDIDDGGLAVLAVLTNVNTPLTPADTNGDSWTPQGANKSLDIITDYRLYTLEATSDGSNVTVTPSFDGNGNGRGISQIWVYNPASADTNVNATLETLTLTELNANVEALISIDATLEALSLTSFNPSVEALISIDATLEALNLNSFNPNVEHNIDVSVTPNVVNLVLNSFNSSITLGELISQSLGLLSTIKTSEGVSSSIKSNIGLKSDLSGNFGINSDFDN